MKLIWTYPLERIKARIRGLAGIEDAMIIYAVHTPWWCVTPPFPPYRLPGTGGDSIEANGIPCDPRGSVLLQTGMDLMAFIEHAAAKPDHYGEHGMLTFAAAHHMNVMTDDLQPTSLGSWKEYDALVDAKLKGKV